MFRPVATHAVFIRWHRIVFVRSANSETLTLKLFFFFAFVNPHSRERAHPQPPSFRSTRGLSWFIVFTDDARSIFPATSRMRAIDLLVYCQKIKMKCNVKFVRQKRTSIVSSQRKYRQNWMLKLISRQETRVKTWKTSAESNNKCRLFNC